MTAVLGTIGVVMCNRIFRRRGALEAGAASGGDSAAAVEYQGDA